MPSRRAQNSDPSQRKLNRAPHPVQERFSPIWPPPSPTAPAVSLVVNGSFAAPSVNLKLVNGSGPDLFPVQLTLD